MNIFYMFWHWHRLFHNITQFEFDNHFCHHILNIVINHTFHTDFERASFWSDTILSLWSSNIYIYVIEITLAASDLKPLSLSIQLNLWVGRYQHDISWPLNIQLLNYVFIQFQHSKWILADIYCLYDISNNCIKIIKFTTTAELWSR